MTGLHLSFKLARDGQTVLGCEMPTGDLDDAANWIRTMADAIDVRIRHEALRKERERWNRDPFAWALPPVSP